MVCRAAVAGLSMRWPSSGGLHSTHATCRPFDSLCRQTAEKRPKAVVWSVRRDFRPLCPARNRHTQAAGVGSVAALAGCVAEAQHVGAPRLVQAAVRGAVSPAVSAAPATPAAYQFRSACREENIRVRPTLWCVAGAGRARRSGENEEPVCSREHGVGLAGQRSPGGTAARRTRSMASASEAAAAVARPHATLIHRLLHTPAAGTRTGPHPSSSSFPPVLFSGTAHIASQR
eukprot:356346-Chlamydomonas_euryale.AAC.4